MIDSSLSWGPDVKIDGPIALDIAFPDGQPDQPFLVACNSKDTRQILVRPANAAAFLVCHDAEVFVCADSDRVLSFLRLALDAVDSTRTGLRLLADVTRDGRLVDLVRLDRQLRVAKGHHLTKHRSWTEVERDWRPATHEDATPESRSSEALAILTVYASMCAKSESLLREVSPSFGGVPAPSESRKMERAPAVHRAPIGNCVEVWGAVCLRHIGSQQFRVDPCRLKALRLLAEDRYRDASHILKRDPDFEGCFHWAGDEVERNHRAYPQLIDRKLRSVLFNLRNKLLSDDQKMKPDLLQSDDGHPSSVPERWGQWAACTRSTWAWREIFRMAEIARIGTTEPAKPPKYETFPFLRSWEPNLAVYRSLASPVFVPREGHTFVSGRLMDLPIRCIAAIHCRRDGYHAGRRNRLQNYLLSEIDGPPLHVIAAELHASWNAKTVSVDDFNRHLDEFLMRVEEDPSCEAEWLVRTEALLRTVPLRLPGSLASNVLEYEHGWAGISEPDYLSLRAAVCRVVPELAQFVEDPTLDVACSRLGLVADDNLEKLVRSDDPDIAAATLRNDLQQGRSRAPLVRYHSAVSADRPPVDVPSRMDSFKYRGLSLGGRVTRSGLSGAVRRQELTMATDEVMLAMAHDIAVAGYRLLGIAADEFVIEVRRGDATEEDLDAIRRVATQAIKRVLGSLVPPIVLARVDEW